MGGGKHNKGCCYTTCVIYATDFNILDEDPIVSLPFVEDGGDWEIADGQLRRKSEGPILCTVMPPAPVDSSYYAYRMQFELTGSGQGPWKIIVNYSDSNNYDWVLLHYRTVGAFSGLLPIFYRKNGGVDSSLFDPETDYPEHLFFIPTPDEAGIPVPINLCYAQEAWTLGSALVGSAQYEAECGDPAPSTSFPTGLGLVGFLTGPTDGSFDDFLWEVAWESNHNCEDCSCICYSSDTDYKCLKEVLYLTLNPISSADANCSSTGTVMEWVLYQSRPVSPPADPTTTPVTFDPYPEKELWFSEPFTLISPVDPCPDWSAASSGSLVWWRLECLGRGAYELALLEYPSGAGSPAVPASNSFARFVVADGLNGGSLETNVDCGVDSETGVVRIDFENFERVLDQLPGSPGPYNCCPLPDDLYEVWVDDAP